MANYLLREQVIKLRHQGLTYSQIKRQLNIPKATLSDWLRNLPLNETQYQALLTNRLLGEDLRREKFRATMANKRLIQLQEILKTQRKVMLPISKKELFIAGLFLYWGEGDKKLGTLCISNTDFRIVKFALYWMVIILGVPKDKIKVGIHIYKDMNIKEILTYWSTKLDLPLSQFIKPYIKNSNRANLSYKGFGYGTCKIYTSNVLLTEKVAMSIRTIAEDCDAWDDRFWYN